MKRWGAALFIELSCCLGSTNSLAAVTLLVLLWASCGLALPAEAARELIVPKFVMVTAEALQTVLDLISHSFPSEITK